MPRDTAFGDFKTVMRWMAREEWRLHATLFGGGRFAFFPVFLTVVLSGALWFFSNQGYAVETLVFALHILALAFGMQTGSLGFVGRDALENMIGDVTLLLYSGRTLPVSNRVLFAAFLVKDVAFYAVVFFVPLAIAVAAGTGSVVAAATAWVSFTGTFALGMALTVALVNAVMGRSRAVKAVVLTTLAGLIAAATAGALPVSLAALTPYGVYTNPSILAVVQSLPPILVLAGIGMALFDPVNESATRTASDRYADLGKRLPFEATSRALVARTLIDVHRSAGGLWKVAFSTGLVAGVAVYLVVLVRDMLGFEPLAGWILAVAISLTAYTTYSTLTQADSAAEYLKLPLAIDDVFTAKALAFAALGVPLALLSQVAAGLYLGVPVSELVASCGLLIGLTWYLFGVVVYLAGFQPEEYLFDTALFMQFFLAVLVGLLPAALLGLLAPSLTPFVLGASAFLSLALFIVGELVRRRASARWYSIVQVEGE